MADQSLEDLEAAARASVAAAKKILDRNEADEILAASAASVPPQHRLVLARWLGWAVLAAAVVGGQHLFYMWRLHEQARAWSHITIPGAVASRVGYDPQNWSMDPTPGYETPAHIDVRATRFCLATTHDLVGWPITRAAPTLIMASIPSRMVAAVEAGRPIPPALAVPDASCANTPGEACTAAAYAPVPSWPLFLRRLSALIRANLARVRAGHHLAIASVAGTPTEAAWMQKSLAAHLPRDPRLSTTSWPPPRPASSLSPNRRADDSMMAPLEDGGPTYFLIGVKDGGAGTSTVCGGETLLLKSEGIKLQGTHP